MSISSDSQLPILGALLVHSQYCVNEENLLLSADLIVFLLNMILWQRACPRIPFAARPGAAELIEKANGKV